MQLTQREEQFFKAMAGNGSAPPPVSREERFMADIVSGESSGLSPLTAEERALNGLVGKIGGGGGDSDFSTAEVTIINNTGDQIFDKFPQCVEEDELGEGSPAAITTTNGFAAGETTIKVPLYKGHAVLVKTTATSIDVTGDIATVGESLIIVSGNGTITFDSLQL